MPSLLFYRLFFVLLNQLLSRLLCLFFLGQFPSLVSSQLVSLPLSQLLGLLLCLLCLLPSLSRFTF